MREIERKDWTDFGAGLFLEEKSEERVPLAYEAGGWGLSRGWDA